MSIDKIFFCTILACCVVFGMTRTSINGSHLHQSAGVWYGVSMMVPSYSESNLACSWYNITVQNDTTFYLMARMRFGENREYGFDVEGHGAIVGSNQIHIDIPRKYELDFEIVNVNDGAIILVEKYNRSYPELLSRKLSASAEEIKVLRSMAPGESSLIYNIPQDNCQNY